MHKYCIEFSYKLHQIAAKQMIVFKIGFDTIESETLPIFVQSGPIWSTRRETRRRGCPPPNYRFAAPAALSPYAVRSAKSRIARMESALVLRNSREYR